MSDWDTILKNAYNEAIENELIKKNEIEEKIKKMKNNILDITEISENDRQVIYNQIERINEISLKNQSLTANLILCDYLIANIDYHLIALDIETIINNLKSVVSNPSVINHAIDLLVENKILTITSESDKKYYSLNETYFKENDI